MRDILEKDWKKLRAMKEELLQVACGRILDKVTKLLENREQGNHQTYLMLWKLMKKEDKKIANMFDNLKRSTAILKLAAWYDYKLIDKITLDQFSKETRKSVELICQ
ncbi:hypothetical protein JW824_12700 [bacterium]|nr:hypothetical protein [bacterium]